MIPVYEPFLTKDNLKFAHDALDTGWISSNDNGKYKELCEEFLRQYLGVEYVLLVNNGTSAMHLASFALRNFYPHIKSLYVPSSAYVAAWNMVSDYNLIPLDSDANTWNADYSNIEEKEDTAFLIVHNLGNPVNVPELQKRFPNSLFIEDACEALGGMYNGFKVGSRSLVSVFSFYGNKTITSGEGGALVTNNKEVYEYCKLLHAQGQSSEKFIHSTYAYNYRMTNVQAAILYGQLQDLGEIFLRKKNVWNFYNQKFSDIKNILLQKTEEGCTPSYWLYGIRLLNNKDYSKNKLRLIFKDIETRPLFYPINYHKQFSHIKEEFKISKMLSEQCVILPSHPGLTFSDLDKVVEAIYDCAKI